MPEGAQANVSIIAAMGSLNVGSTAGLQLARPQGTLPCISGTQGSTASGTSSPVNKLLTVAPPLIVAPLFTVVNWNWEERPFNARWDVVWRNSWKFGTTGWLTLW